MSPREQRTKGIQRRVTSKGETKYHVRYRRPDGSRPGDTFDTEDEAMAFLLKVRRAKRTNTLEAIDAGNLTLAKLADEWWANCATKLATSTQAAYSVFLDRYVIPELGNETIARLAAMPNLLYDFQTALEGRVGVAAVRKTMFLLQGMMRYAVQRGYAATNPVQAIQKPKSQAKRPVRALSLEAVEWMRATAMDRSDLFTATLIALLAYSGARTGEAFTLRWTDLRDRVVVIYTGNDNGREKETKTGTNRTARFLSPLAADLAAWKAFAKPQSADAYVFPRSDGGAFTKDDWDNWRNRSFKPLALMAGATGMRPYDLRHVFVSLLIAEGKGIAYIAAQAGHSQEMTLRTYSHLFEEFEGGEKIDAAAEVLRWRGIVAEKRGSR